MHYHATRVTRRADRRIMGKPGARENVCGAALTDCDMVARDFLTSARAGWIRPATGATACPTCRELLEGGRA